MMRKLNVIRGGIATGGFPARLFRCDHSRLLAPYHEAWQISFSFHGCKLDTSPSRKQNLIWHCTETLMSPQDQKIERRLAAIFAADVAGYSRLMNQNEVGTLRSLTASREIIDRLITEYGGRIANTAGDSVLAEFPSAVDAVRCAVDLQDALVSVNHDKPDQQCLQFRIGVHVGDVMVRGNDLLGDSVNIAARLEGLADPGGVCISGDAYRQVRKALSFQFHDLGPQQVKNIEEPVHAYALSFISTRTGTQHRDLPAEPSAAAR
jgi:adenylate cyclase